MHGRTRRAIDDAVARAVIDTNLLGAWRVTQAMLPLLRGSEHARVVMVSSGATWPGAGQMGGSSTTPHRSAGDLAPNNR